MFPVNQDLAYFSHMNATCTILSRLAGKLSVVSAAFFLTLYYKMVDVETLHETGRGMQEEKSRDEIRRFRLRCRQMYTAYTSPLESLPGKRDNFSHMNKKIIW